MKLLVMCLNLGIITTLMVFYVPALGAHAPPAQFQTCQKIKLAFGGKLKERSSVETTELAQLRGYLYGMLESLHEQKKIGDASHAKLLRDLDPQNYIEFCEKHPDGKAENWLTDSSENPKG